MLARYGSWVEKTPHAVAVEDRAHSFSYQEIDDVARSVMRRLEGRVSAGDIVAVCLDRSAALVAVAVAVARLGAVYLPLGPKPGERRLADLLAELRITAVIGSREALPGSGPEVELPVPSVGANALPMTVAEFVAPTPKAASAPEGTFYAVLTSGSTGKPKAVAVGGESLSGLVRWYHDLSGLGPGDRISLLMAVPFDPHLGDLWGGLAYGATLAVAPGAARYSTDRLVEWYRSAKVDFSVLATPMAEPLLAGPWPQGLRLRNLLIGGDRLRSWPQPDATARVHNVYGPAEATINVTAALLNPAADRATPPIGNPIPGVTLCVVDDQGRIVPRGEAGELLIGGSCLAIGYLDQELTRERFVPAPEGAGVTRVYRTGDKVRMADDGVLEFLGRLDDQVKISGVRIEPAEVEAALEQDAQVRRVVVAVRRHERGRTGLVAFVEPVPGVVLDEDVLLAGARAALPLQAVPGAVYPVEDFPLNQNGKVDRAALLAGVPVESDGELNGETQQQLAELWRGLLGAESVHADSNFFELGGNSMHAVALAGAVKQTFGVELSMKTVMGVRLLRELADAIDAERAQARSAGEPVGAAAVTEW
ncbi:non-ribosomal peptide synthetase [Streptomyces sp. NPDC051162]|uniref:non-ribosomal peptide synthetase n=1 Tax=Streptomyces sp. NPDC051162 TaxID=3154747 RepID=UPI00341EC4E8